MSKWKVKGYGIRFLIFMLWAVSVVGCGAGKDSDIEEPVLEEQQTKQGENGQLERQETETEDTQLEDREENQGGNDAEGKLKNTEQGMEIESPQILKFVDAWGEWHETEINPNVKKHSYQWQYLTRDGEAFQYEDEAYYTRKGIDVSHHQGSIDWNQVKEAGYEFVFVRMVYRGYGSEGSLNLDKAYLDNILGAQAAGMDVGIYVFSQAVNETEAIEEAQMVIDYLKDIELQLPVVFDPELIRDDTARTDEVTGEQFTKNAIAFCEQVKSAGYTPMIYSNMVWEAELFDLEKLQEYPIWYADYEPVPQTPYEFQFWQCSEDGTVPGIQGKVDIDVQFVAK